MGLARHGAGLCSRYPRTLQGPQGAACGTARAALQGGTEEAKICKNVTGERPILCQGGCGMLSKAPLLLRAGLIHRWWQMEGARSDPRGCSHLLGAANYEWLLITVSMGQRGLLLSALADLALQMLPNI